MEYFKKLRLLLDRETKYYLMLLIIFSILISVVEAIGISAIMPFIDISTNFDNIHSNQYYQQIFDFFNFEDEVNFAITFGFFLFGFYVFRGGINLVYSYQMVRFKEKLYAKITKRLVKVYRTMPYQIFTNKNSSYLTKVIITEAELMSAAIEAVLLMISEIFIVIFIYILMLFASWKITLIFSAVLMIKMYLITQTISKKIKIVGVVRAESQEKFYEIINRLFGNFEHIKLQDVNKLESSNDEFSETINKYSESNIRQGFLKAIPKLLIETGGFSLIIFLLIALLYLNQSNVLYILPILSLFVLALYRILPSINRIIGSYNLLMYHHKSIDIIDEELKTFQESLANETVKFKHKIELINVNFSHQNKVVLNNVNLIIEKGEKIAFIGESGSGKSTLAYLIIGLYEPNQGEMKIDDVLIDESNLQNWRSQIGYISQQVYLFDGTIKENVCFGRELDITLLNDVLKQASIFDFLQTKQGIDTLVGEGGIQLSGGQRQRIAIARALYGQPEILVLDEATSSLDDITEKKIMDEIYRISKDKTLIIIAHRISTINGCDKIYKLNNKTFEQYRAE
jgi:ATP-binding cassette, subfamily B, bacterial PglK